MQIILERKLESSVFGRLQQKRENFMKKKIPKEISVYDTHDTSSFIDRSKKMKLEAAAWKIGSVGEFLGLSEEEAAYIELKLSLSKNIQKRRRSLKLTQKDFAKMIKSSQSRVAKMESGDPTVSIDLLVKSLLTLKNPKQQLSRILPR